MHETVITQQKNCVEGGEGVAKSEPMLSQTERVLIEINVMHLNSTKSTHTVLLKSALHFYS